MLKTILKDIIEQKNIRLGEPWKFKKDSVGILIPIMKDDDGKRDYVLLEEVKDKLDIKDTGSIDQIKVKSKTDEPVFVRMGTIFEGDTQARAANTSIIIMPAKEKEIVVPVSCVHASHAISGGTNMRAGGYAPRETMVMFVAKADQGRVWNSVNRYHSKQSAKLASVGAVASDNLSETMKTVEKGKKEIKEILKEVPVLENQIGVIVLDVDVVKAIEMFDSSKSWQAFHEEIIKKYDDILTKGGKGDLFEVKLKPEAIQEAIEEFVENIGLSEQKSVFKDGIAETFSLIHSKVLGEFTVLGDKVIHVFATKKEEEDFKETKEARSYVGLGLGNLQESNSERIYPTESSRHTATLKAMK